MFNIKIVRNKSSLKKNNTHVLTINGWRCYDGTIDNCEKYIEGLDNNLNDYNVLFSDEQNHQTNSYYGHLEECEDHLEKCYDYVEGVRISLGDYNSMIDDCWCVINEYTLREESCQIYNDIIEATRIKDNSAR